MSILNMGVIIRAHHSLDHLCTKRGLMMAKGLAANGAKTYIGSRRRNVVERAAEAHAHGLSGRLIP